MTNDNAERIPVSKNTEVYHTDLDCHQLPERPRWFRREVAEAWYEECYYCKGNSLPTPDGDAWASLEALEDASNE